MKTTPVFAAIAITLAASGAAMAQEATYEYPQAAVSSTTRAAVQAELQQARANGQLQVGEALVGPTTTFVAQRSREDVRTETRSARASGKLRALNEEAISFAPELARTPAARLVALK